MTKQVQSNIPRRLLEQRKMLRFVELETTDGGELLEAMIQAIGITETARRLCRDHRTITSYRKRKRVPYPVWEWLILAAANVSNSRDPSLGAVRWHYPKRKDMKTSAKRKRDELRASLEQRQRETRARDWADTLEEAVDPYA